MSEAPNLNHPAWIAFQEEIRRVPLGDQSIKSWTLEQINTRKQIGKNFWIMLFEEQHQSLLLPDGRPEHLPCNFYINSVGMPQRFIMREQGDPLTAHYRCISGHLGTMPNTGHLVNVPDLKYEDLTEIQEYTGYALAIVNTSQGEMIFRDPLGYLASTFLCPSDWVE